jgi:hypothetical protein
VCSRICRNEEFIDFSEHPSATKLRRAIVEFSDHLDPKYFATELASSSSTPW